MWCRRRPCRRVDSTVTNADGSATQTSQLYNITAAGNALTEQDITTTSGDGRTQNLQSDVTLATGAAPTTENTRFVISAGTTGTLWLNQVSLFPPTYNQRANGNRVDLMRLMAGLKPGFLRFPGGNYLEGNTIAQRFEWKNTIGPISQRAGHESPWGYRSDDGWVCSSF